MIKIIRAAAEQEVVDRDRELTIGIGGNDQAWVEPVCAANQRQQSALGIKESQLGDQPRIDPLGVQRDSQRLFGVRGKAIVIYPRGGRLVNQHGTAAGRQMLVDRCRLGCRLADRGRFDHRVLRNDKHSRIADPISTRGAHFVTTGRHFRWDIQLELPRLDRSDGPFGSIGRDRFTQHFGNDSRIRKLQSIDRLKLVATRDFDFDSRTGLSGTRLDRRQFDHRVLG